MVIFNKFKFPILTILALVSFIFIAGCASTATNIGNNLFRTSCGGMMNGWSSCYDAARAQCTSGFNEQDRREIKHPGEWNDFCACMIYPVDRDLVFSCR